MSPGSRTPKRRSARSAERRVRPNVNRRAAAERRRAYLLRAGVAVQWLAGAAVLVLASFLFIFVHDVFVQCDYFKAKTIEIEGGRRLSAATILAQAGIREGLNVLSVNLSAAQKRLLAHPWIAEAEVGREIPSTLRLRIREHVPAAVIDLGTRFLLNDRGEVFKLWEDSDPRGLPIVQGLAAGDLRVAQRSSGARSLALPPAMSPVPAETLRSRPMEAVVQVLALGRETGIVLPTAEVQAIRVDRELGLTIVAFEAAKSIRLGYDDYRSKYRLLADMIAFLQRQPSIHDFERIDLNDLNRVLVSPAKTALRLAGR